MSGQLEVRYFRENTVSLILHVGVFYFTLGNVNPKFRSKLKSIQLVALVRRVHLVKYGMNAVLRPIVDDLKRLVSDTVYMSCYSSEYVQAM